VPYGLIFGRRNVVAPLNGSGRLVSVEVGPQRESKLFLEDRSQVRRMPAASEHSVEHMIEETGNMLRLSVVESSQRQGHFIATSGYSSPVVE